MTSPPDLPFDHTRTIDSSRKTSRRKYIVLFCYLAALVVVVLALRSSLVSLPELTPRNLLLFAGMAMLTLPLMAIRGELNTISFRLGHGLRPHWDGFCLAVWNTTANLFPFSPGLAAKGLLLHRMYAVRVRDYVALTFFVFLTAISASGLSALYSLFLLGNGDIWLWCGFGVMSLAAIPCSAVVRGRLPRLPLLPKIIDQSTDLDRPWGFLILIHIILVHVEAFRLLGAFSITGYEPITFAAIVVMSSGTILTRLANITPGGIGIREGIIVGLASATNVPLEVSLLAAGIDRIAAILGLACTFLLVASVESWRSRSISDSAHRARPTSTESEPKVSA